MSRLFWRILHRFMPIDRFPQTYDRLSKGTENKQKQDIVDILQKPIPRGSGTYFRMQEYYLKRTKKDFVKLRKN